MWCDAISGVVLVGHNVDVPEIGRAVQHGVMRFWVWHYDFRMKISGSGVQWNVA